jgi:hypothetical protein
VSKLAYSLLLAGGACVACGGRVDSGDLASSDGAEPATTPANELTPTGCSPTADPQNPPKNGSELWLNGFRDALQITGVASDGDGNVLMARSGSELLKFTAGGARVWSKPFGSLVATDRDGNAYVTGTLTGTMQLGENRLVSKGGTDVYVAKLAPSGDVLYGVALGGPGAQDVQSLAVDAATNVVISGAGIGTVKFDRDANIVWTKSFYGYVTFDSRGDLLVTGALSGTMDFGSGALSSAGGKDIFVTKLAPDGSLLFVRSFGDESPRQQGQAVAVDRSDNVLVTGSFDGNVDFGDNVLSLSEANLPSEVWCETAGFALKLDANGDTLWSRALGPMRELTGVASDAAGEVIVSGALPGNVSPYQLSFLTKLDAGGAQLWQRSEWPATGIGSGNGVVVDACNDILWSVSVLPTIGDDKQPYIAKLSP